MTVLKALTKAPVLSGLAAAEVAMTLLGAFHVFDPRALHRSAGASREDRRERLGRDDRHRAMVRRAAHRLTPLSGKLVGGSPGNDPIGNIVEQGVNAIQPSAFVENSDTTLVINVLQGQAVTSIYAIFITANWPPGSTQGEIWVNEAVVGRTPTLTIGASETNQ